MDIGYLNNYNLNIYGIFFGTLVAQLISAIWLGPLFGKQWAKYCRWNEEELKKYLGDRQRSRIAAIGAFLEQLISTIVFAFLFHNLQIQTYCGALQLAVLVWLGFMVTHLSSEVFWHDVRVPFYLISISCYLVRTIALATAYTLVAL